MLCGTKFQHRLFPARSQLLLSQRGAMIMHPDLVIHSGCVFGGRAGKLAAKALPPAIFIAVESNRQARPFPKRLGPSDVASRPVLGELQFVHEGDGE